MNSPHYHNDTHYGHQQADNAPRQRAKLENLSLGVIFLLTVVLGAVAAYGIATAFPHQMKAFLISFDQFGITNVGASEQSRIRRINRLAITHEEKQVLIKRTVFLGATREMVDMALGTPTCSYSTNATADKKVAEVWVYFIEGDPKPTLLAFQNNELVNAGRASALDSCK